MNERQSFYVGIKAVIKNSSGNILIVKDNDRNKWELPGGRLDANERIESALAKELDEEIPGTSLTSIGDVLHISVGDFTVENNHKLLLIFYTAQAHVPTIKDLGDEHNDIEWVDVSTLDSFDLYTSDKIALTKALK